MKREGAAAATTFENGNIDNLHNIGNMVSWVNPME
jgi:hypothetical protein